MNFSICETERGNNAFRNTETGSAVLFIHLESRKYLQASFTPMNYPSWEVSTIELEREDLENHIARVLADWHVDKCQLNINIDEWGDVVDYDLIVDCIVDHAINTAHAAGRNLTKTEAELDSAIVDSATACEYTITKDMHEECYRRILDEFKR